MASASRFITPYDDPKGSTNIVIPSNLSSWDLSVLVLGLAGVQVDAPPTLTILPSTFAQYRLKGQPGTGSPITEARWWRLGLLGGLEPHSDRTDSHSLTREREECRLPGGVCSRITVEHSPLVGGVPDLDLPSLGTNF